MLEISAPGVRVLDDALEFGDIASGASVTSSDTFSIRQDRRYSFSESALSWQINATSAILDISDIQPAGGPPGTEIHLRVDGVSESQVPIKLFLSEQELSFSQASSDPARLSFLVPNDSVGGAIHITQGTRISNKKWLTVPIPPARHITNPESGVPYLDGGFNVWRKTT